MVALVQIKKKIMLFSSTTIQLGVFWFINLVRERQAGKLVFRAPTDGSIGGAVFY